MATGRLCRQVARKDVDKEKLALRVARQPERIAELLDGLSSDTAAIRYGCAKLLRIIGEKAPAALYPHMDFFVRLLDDDNKIMQWEGIHVIGNLTRVDSKNAFEGIFERYFAFVSGPVMISAANVIAGAATIALAKPALTERIVGEILKVQRAKYKTLECRRVALGHAIKSFDRFFEQIRDKKPVIAMVKRQLKSPRRANRRAAERFLKRHDLA